jgi:dTDP-4-dehydrorhamnose 3,5-epimerase-like enzyme
MIEILNPVFSHTDERGQILQLVSDGYHQVNVIQTFAGSTRGRMHYHEHNSELFYIISGSLQLGCMDVRTGETQQYSFRQGDMFKVPPMIGHNFVFTEDTLIISMYSSGVELPNGTKDIVEMK